MPDQPPSQRDKRAQPSLNAHILARARSRAPSREDAVGPQGPAPPPAPTLSHFAREGVRVRLECERCDHRVDAPAAHWMARFGDVAMAHVESRARCSACGARDAVDARPLYAYRSAQGFENAPT